MLININYKQPCGSPGAYLNIHAISRESSTILGWWRSCEHLGFLNFFTHTIFVFFCLCRILWFTFNDPIWKIISTIIARVYEENFFTVGLCVYIINIGCCRTSDKKKERNNSNYYLSECVSVYENVVLYIILLVERLLIFSRHTSCACFQSMMLEALVPKKYQLFLLKFASSTHWNFLSYSKIYQFISYFPLLFISNIL